MTDEEIKALAFKHCYATTVANGWVFRSELDRGLKDFVSAIRNAALQEAMEECDSLDQHSFGITPNQCADAIRALKEENA
jgi:hypothetical protein